MQTIHTYPQTIHPLKWDFTQQDGELFLMGYPISLIGQVHQIKEILPVPDSTAVDIRTGITSEVEERWATKIANPTILDEILWHPTYSVLQVKIWFDKHSMTLPFLKIFNDGQGNLLVETAVKVEQGATRLQAAVHTDGFAPPTFDTLNAQTFSLQERRTKHEQAQFHKQLLQADVIQSVQYNRVYYTKESLTPAQFLIVHAAWLSFFYKFAYDKAWIQTNAASAAAPSNKKVTLRSEK